MYDKNQSREFGESVEDDQAEIWRYVNLPTLLQMLQTRTLFFPSVATLAATDPWEGRWYPEELRVVRNGLKESMEKQLDGDAGIEEDRNRLEKTDVTATIQEAIGKGVYVSCWHKNSDESAAMWSIYGANHGIALKSRVGLLKAALAVEERPVAILRVQYGSSLGMKEPPILLALRKRNSFSHERELRALVVTDPSNDVGIPIKVNIETLIEKMYVWPLAPSWMVDVINTEVRLHGLDKAIEKSPLYDPA